jgi:hypothetical protein
MRYRLRTLLIAVAAAGVSLAILLNVSALTWKFLHSITCAALLFAFGVSILGPQKWRLPAIAFLGGSGLFLLYVRLVVGEYDESVPHALITTDLAHFFWSAIKTETPRGFSTPIQNPDWVHFLGVANLLMAIWIGTAMSILAAGRRT